MINSCVITNRETHASNSLYCLPVRWARTVDRIVLCRRNIQLWWASLQKKLLSFYLWSLIYVSELSKELINDWSAILLCLPCIIFIFHEYMCGFLLFTEFWCFAMRFSGCCEIWLSHRQNNIFVAKHLLAINDTTSE